MLRTLRRASILVIALLAGCTFSLHPLYTDDTLHFDDKLLGDYSGDLGAIRVERGEGKSYALTTNDAKREKMGVLRLVKLGDSLFYDWERTAGDGVEIIRPEGTKAVHAVGRITIDGDEVAFLTFDNEDEVLKGPGVQLTDLVTTFNGGEQQSMQMLAMSTADLQAFYRKQAPKMTKPQWKMRKTAAAAPK